MKAYERVLLWCALLGGATNSYELADNTATRIVAGVVIPVFFVGVCVALYRQITERER
jgi:hypothetical protein